MIYYYDIRFERQNIRKKNLLCLDVRFLILTLYPSNFCILKSNWLTDEIPLSDWPRDGILASDLFMNELLLLSPLDDLLLSCISFCLKNERLKKSF